MQLNTFLGFSDETELLGTGTFGTVCLAKVFKNGIEQTAAVKKAQPSSISLKSLMCYTAELNKGSVVSMK